MGADRAHFGHGNPVNRTLRRYVLSVVGLPPRPLPIMSTLSIVLLIIVGLIALILLLASMKPDRFKVERSVTINATPETIFPLVNNFHQWAGWSPWEKLDPNMKRSYSGADSGVGAQYAWEGGKAGTGSMDIFSSQPSSAIDINLKFEKPFKAHSIAMFRFIPSGNATRVVWTMEGPNIFIGKIMSVFMSMDEMNGRNFDKGLAAMKEIAERS